jgi:hypothetical protein
LSVRLRRLDRRPDRPPARAEYAEATTTESEARARLIAALYASVGRFEQFKDLSLLYFAAASYSETLRRLGRGTRAPDFLLCPDPVFGPRLRGFAAGVGPSARIRSPARIAPQERQPPSPTGPVPA